MLISAGGGEGRGRSLPASEGTLRQASSSDLQDGEKEKRFKTVPVGDFREPSGDERAGRC